jgi:hypothetical protein
MSENVDRDSVASHCSSAHGYIVELEPGVWLAEWSGDPGRTLERASAKVYPSEVAAINGKARASRYRKFWGAKVIKVDDAVCSCGKSSEYNERTGKYVGCCHQCMPF